jgi:molybdenum cofactor synthesis domain-containing protein
MMRRTERPVEHIPRTETVRLICIKVPAPSKEESVPLQDACGRVAARDLKSKLNLPAVKCSRWDGIAFSYRNYIACHGDVSAWKPERDYAFSNTGIPIRNDVFDTMVMIEKTVFEGEHLVSISQPDLAAGQNIIPVGERMAVGEVLVPAGTRLSPSHLNRLASGGLLNVPVFRRPRVAILPTGNELISCSCTPDPEKTIESNSFSMAAKIRLWGGEPVVFPILPDREQALQEQLLEAASSADLIVIGGGSGRGRYDILQAAVAEIGRLLFSSVEHGPGKRTCFALVGDTPVIGLVGPPGGEEMTFDFYVRPAVLACLKQPYTVTTVQAVLDEDIPAHERVSFFYTMKLYRDEKDDFLHASPLPHAGLDRTIAEHNGYLFVKKPSGGFRKGDIAQVEVRTGAENL